MLLSIVMVLALAAIPVFAAGPEVYGVGTVSAACLNIRSGPGTGEPVIGSVPQGETIVIIERTDNTWYHVNYEGTDGYVAAQYLTNVSTTSTELTAVGEINGAGVNVRKGPGTSYESVGTCNTGYRLRVLGLENGWYRIDYQGSTAYVFSSYLSIVSPYYAVGVINTAKGEEVAAFALQFVGYEYVYGGASPETGFDCSGLVYYCFRQLGYDMIHHGATSQYLNYGYEVTRDELIAGDLVFFSNDSGDEIEHVGIYIGDGQFVHASTSTTGVIISSIDENYYIRNWYGAKRVAY
jgi:cell wall-associated NlpC family hydrolase